MPNGGARPGAGRKKGSGAGVDLSRAGSLPTSERNKVTRRLVERVNDIEISPLEVMLLDMKMRHDEANKWLAAAESSQDDQAREDMLTVAKRESAAAVDTASKLAPYIHAKLQTTTIKGEAEAPLAISLLGPSDLRARVRGV